MSDPIPASAPRPGAIEKVKSGAAVLGALAGAVTALYGVYEKVRTEAKAYTAASYNTLAPQMNQIGDALKQLQQENQQLREIVAQHQGKPRLAERPAAATTRRNGKKPAAPAAGSPTAAATPPAATPDPAPAAGTPAQPAAQPAAPAGTPPPATGEPPRAAAEPPPGNDPVGGLLDTVGRTREAIDSLRRVPENFENVLGKKK